ncbi:MAG: hypothetical protein Q8928_08855 [Bacteroidota bacterium]|nr:hypothetical protein [Bacteroidota bacterium]
MINKISFLNLGFLLIFLVSSCHSSEKKATSDSAGIKYSFNNKSSSSQSFLKEIRGQRISVIVKNETNAFSTEKSDSTFLKSVIDIKGFPKEYRDSIMVKDLCESLGLDMIKSGYIDKVDVITSEDSEKLYLIYDFKWSESKNSFKNSQLTFTFWWNDKEQKVEKVNYKK